MLHRMQGMNGVPGKRHSTVLESVIVSMFVKPDKYKLSKNESLHNIL